MSLNLVRKYRASLGRGAEQRTKGRRDISGTAVRGWLRTLEGRQSDTPRHVSR